MVQLDGEIGMKFLCDCGEPVEVAVIIENNNIIIKVIPCLDCMHEKYIEGEQAGYEACSMAEK